MGDCYSLGFACFIKQRTAKKRSNNLVYLIFAFGKDLLTIRVWDDNQYPLLRS